MAMRRSFASRCRPQPASFVPKTWLKISSATEGLAVINARSVSRAAEANSEDPETLFRDGRSLVKHASEAKFMKPGTASVRSIGRVQYDNARLSISKDDNGAEPC